MQEALTASVAALLRPGAECPDRQEWLVLIEAARDHGVLPLISEAAARANWDRGFVAAVRADVAAQTALALANERELKRVLDGLGEAGLSPLLFKGAHLAYTLYRSPELRPRLDTDFLIREEDRAAVNDCLGRLDYRPLEYVTGAVAFGQVPYGRIDGSGASFTIDVHWRLANPQAFAHRLGFEELAGSAVRIPRLGSNALAPGFAHALTIASMHRAAHHGSTHRLLWLYDVHLLASVLNKTAWREAIDLAIERGLAPVVASALTDARDRIGTALPATVLAELNAHQADRDVLEFVEGRMSQLRVAASDWRRLAGMRDRARYLREHLFPPADYIRHRYGVSSPLALPLLYTHRIVAGARKWL
jgi:hypothetical protein